MLIERENISTDYSALLDIALIHRFHNQVDGIHRAELLEQSLAVGLDGIVRHEQGGRDLARGLSLGYLI